MRRRNMRRIKLALSEMKAVSRGFSSCRGAAPCSVLGPAARPPWLEDSDGGEGGGEAGNGVGVAGPDPACPRVLGGGEACLPVGALRSAL